MPAGNVPAGNNCSFSWSPGFFSCFELPPVRIHICSTPLGNGWAGFGACPYVQLALYSGGYSAFFLSTHPHRTGADFIRRLPLPFTFNSAPHRPGYIAAILHAGVVMLPLRAPVRCPPMLCARFLTGVTYVCAGHRRLFKLHYGLVQPVFLTQLDWLWRFAAYRVLAAAMRMQACSARGSYTTTTHCVYSVLDAATFCRRHPPDSSPVSCIVTAT